MSLITLLGFKERTCGCVIGRYRELATNREITFVEAWGPECDLVGHRGSHAGSSEASHLSGAAHATAGEVRTA